MNKIGIDIMGGDNAPHVPLNASIRFAKKFKDVELHLYGEQDVFFNKEIPRNIILHFTSEIISNDEEPVMAIRKKKDSSICQAVKMLSVDELNGVLSAGSTGALVALGTFVAKRSDGVKRPGLPGFLPSKNKSHPTILLDIGANVDAKPEHLLDYAKIASVYASVIYGVEKPKVSLLNIGSEDKKGNKLYKDTNELLSECKELNFVGNIEARDVLTTENNIIVMDGFTGNILIKNIEGNLSFFNKMLKKIFMSNLISNFAAILLKNKLMNMKNDFSYKKIGGTPVLGIKKLIVKAHGSSDEDTFYNAIVSTKLMIEKDLINKLN